MVPSLPLDVLLSIIELDKGDETALKAWALVSRQLLPFARLHLYRTIDMRRYPGIVSGERLFVRLYHFISNNPHIGPFVRNLHFFEVDALHPYMTLSCEHRDFPKLLKLLPGLQGFGLHFKEVTSWQDRSRTFVTAMEELMQRPMFKELHLSEIIRVPISLLNRCSSLKKLHLNVVTFINPQDSLRFDSSRKGQRLTASREATPPPPEVCSIYLEEASFSATDVEIFDWTSPLFLVSFAKLKSLNVDIECEDFDRLWKAIHSVRASLTRLKLGQTRRALGHSIYTSNSFLHPTGDPSAENHLDIATLRPLINLDHLTIVISFPNTRSNSLCERIISEWCTLLNTAPKTLQWISITLNFTFFEKKGLKTILESSTPGHRSLSDTKGKGSPNILAHLDKQLADSALLPALAGVGITVQRPNPNIGPLPRLWEDKDNEYPPSPMKREILRISVLRMMKLTRRRFETTVGSEMSSFSVSVI